MFIDIISIDLFDQNACITCAKVRLRHMDITGIDLFDQIWIWHVLCVGTDVTNYKIERSRISVEIPQVVVGDIIREAYERPKASSMISPTTTRGIN